MRNNLPLQTFFIQIARALAAAGTVILCSRFMGAAGRGELSIVLFYIQIAMVINEYVGGSSIAALLVKMPASRILPAAVFWTVLVTIGYSVFGIANSGFNWWSVLFVLFLGLLTIQYSVYQAKAKVHQRNILQAGIEVSKGVGILLFFLWFKHLYTVDVVMVFALITMAAFFVSSAFLKNHLGEITAVQSPPSSIFKDGFWSQNGHLVMFLNYRLMLLFIEKYSGLAEAGLYANALLIADTIWIFANSFGVIAHMHILQSENPRFKADITVRYAAVAVLGTVVLCIIGLLVPNTLYVWVFGKEFQGLKRVFILLIPAITALGFASLFSHFLHAITAYKKLFIANLLGLLIQVLFAVFLLPEYGLEGACWSANAGFMALSLMVFGIFLKENPEAKMKGVFHIKTLWQTFLNRG